MSATTRPHRTALERQLIRLVADALPILELLAAGRVAGEGSPHDLSKIVR